MPDDDLRPSGPLRTPGGDVPDPPADDLKLVERVLSGSIEDWHEFVLRYSGLIQAVIRRNLYAPEEDEVRSAFVDVLATLYRGGLRTYQGRSSLRSWLILVARNHAMQALRRRFGRQGIPKAIAALGKTEREIFRLFYLQGASLEAIHHRLSGADRSLTKDAILQGLDRIDALMGPRALRRSAYERRARTVGEASGRLLELIDRIQLQAEARESAARPDEALLAAEAERAREIVRRVRERLGSEDLRVLDLWFEEDLPADEIARRLDLGSRRKVYTLVNRALRRLRRLVGADRIDPDQIW